MTAPALCTRAGSGPASIAVSRLAIEWPVNSTRMSPKVYFSLSLLLRVVLFVALPSHCFVYVAMNMAMGDGRGVGGHMD